MDLHLLAGRRAFPKAQELLAGSPIVPARELVVGWYGAAVHPETGAFALVARDGGQDDLIGQRVRVRAGKASVIVYVLGDALLPDGTELGLARRAFLGLARLSLETLDCEVARIL